MSHVNTSHIRPPTVRLQCRPFRPAKSVRGPARCGPAAPSDDASTSSRLSRRETLGVAAAGAVAAAGFSRSGRADAAPAAPAAASPAAEPGVGGSSKQQRDRIELGRSGELGAHAWGQRAVISKRKARLKACRSLSLLIQRVCEHDPSVSARLQGLPLLLPLHQEPSCTMLPVRRQHQSMSTRKHGC